MSPVRIAVVGAGPSGLVTAAVLAELGHEVQVFEQAPDVGGVWSTTRAYPGVRTQDDRVTYAFSDVPMPADFPEHPTGSHVRSYLEHYARVKGLTQRIRLSTAVRSAEPTPSGDGWVLHVAGPAGPATHRADWLVMANGVFSTPHVPGWPGRAEFEAHGGRVVVPGALGDGAALAGQRVVVVGWGKTACDVATWSSGRARSTTVVARTLLWKLPERIGGGLTFRHVLLTRLGEHLMSPSRATAAARLGALASLPARRTARWLLRRQISRRHGLRALGLVPSRPLPHCDSLVTEGFFDAVAAGRLAVLSELSVQGLGAVDGVPGVRLSDGRWLPADVVVAATGFEQDLSPLASAVQAALRDDDGVLRLQRRILPLDVPRLAFAGWGHTYRSPVTAEIGAVWLAAHLAGRLRERSPAEVRRTADRYHLTRRQAAAHGEAPLPSGSFAALDALLDDLGMPLPAAQRLRQWVVPFAPAGYAGLLPALRRRLGQPASSRPAAPAPVREGSSQHAPSLASSTGSKGSSPPPG